MNPSRPEPNVEGQQITLDLKEAARVAQLAGRQAVRNIMEVRERYSPWEVTEACLKISLLLAFMEKIQTMPSPHLRLFDELTVDQLSNMRTVEGIQESHPIDLVLLHPLPEGPCADGNYAWDKRHQAPFGLVEIKKNYERVTSDARLLRDMTGASTGTPPLIWILLVVLINGDSKEGVRRKESEVNKKVEKYSLRSLTSCDPEEARFMDDCDVDDRWFDVMCYGKAVDP
jgi:hypothetical protein